ncbi:hypothetical protein NO263_03360 [Gluconacetobacter entanii]|uniref:Uncharacterized protein n=1 Tax=Gluconacetobacter entanii TaxID=108528 RepID=A0ABT3K2J5_9PROT|nr:hypothetical protein [Gluconacetobacter entanii]MCW4589613.1 hypothetical protein [Gluconacetobacter entanii]MCW4593039.1 hypothetical protein [Gluconacetobacter entanii]NPC89181.1 hypothetical protein [Gluconacetobacter entanii]
MKDDELNLFDLNRKKERIDKGISTYEVKIFTSIGEEISNCDTLIKERKEEIANLDKKIENITSERDNAEKNIYSTINDINNKIYSSLTVNHNAYTTINLVDFLPNISIYERFTALASLFICLLVFSMMFIHLLIN